MSHNSTDEIHRMCMMDLGRVPNRWEAIEWEQIQVVRWQGYTGRTLDPYAKLSPEDLKEFTSWLVKEVQA